MSSIPLYSNESGVEYKEIEYTNKSTYKGQMMKKDSSNQHLVRTFDG